MNLDCILYEFLITTDYFIFSKIGFFLYDNDFVHAFTFFSKVFENCKKIPYGFRIFYWELSYYYFEQLVSNGFISFFFSDSGYLKRNYAIFFDNYYIYHTFVFNWSFIYGLKFTVSILFLIFIRAGIPRYRYDYLTKLGWSKFVLFSLYILIFIYLIFVLI